MIATHHSGALSVAGRHFPRRQRLDRTQSLADGDIARLLLTVELALSSQGSWDEVTDALLQAKAMRPDLSSDAGLFYGAPALAFVLDATGVQCRARWAHELAALDQMLVDLSMERLGAAGARAQAGAPVRGSEFDLMNGLTGLGVVLLRRAVHGSVYGDALIRTLSGVLSYLVDRARDRVLEGVQLPGWWASNPPELGPAGGAAVLGGCAHLGMARGGAGILAFLAASLRAGYTVPGHAAAIRNMVAWYTRWQQEAPNKVIWWPQRLTLEELRTEQIHQIGPSEPTWASGTPGIGRALQMAAIALRNAPGRVAAEDAIASCLTRSQLDPMNEPDLYAGTGGMYMTVLRAAEDAERHRPVHSAGSSKLSHRVGLAADAASRTSRVLPDSGDTEFLFGRFGTRLVFEALRSRAAPVSACDGVLGIAWAE